MNKLLLAILLTFFTIQTTYAHNQVVSPEVDISINVENDGFFDITQYLTFDNFDQDAYASFINDKTSINIEIPANIPASFWLAYMNDQMPNSVEDQCKFNVTASDSNNVSIQVAQLPDSFVTCSLSGSAQTHDLLLHVSFKTDYFKKFLIEQKQV